MFIKVEVHTTIKTKDLLLWEEFKVDTNISVIDDDRYCNFQEKVLDYYRTNNPDYSIDVSSGENSVEFDFCDGFNDYLDLKDLNFIFEEFKKEFCPE